jgi:hypothetical protein
MRSPLFLALVLLLAALVAGCLTPLELPPVEPPSVIKLELTDSSGAPLAFAQVVGLQGDTPLVITSTGLDGKAKLRLPEGVDQILVHKADHWAITNGVPARGEMKVALGAGASGSPEIPVLAFRTPLDLGSMEYLLAVGTACLDSLPNKDCGLGEPSVEVDAAGLIYASGVCCIGGAPPVYVSRDDGLSFEPLATPSGIREAFGIEGDFAIDQDGTMYFVDIELAATFQLTAWDKDGGYLHHTKWPAPPLVDRPWLRAEGSGGLYYVYNTGSATNVYTSSDGGRTWSATPRVSLPYGLGNPVKGPADGELWVIGGNEEGKRRADVTRDGGETWATEATTSPAGGRFPVGAFDEAGNLYLVSNVDDTIHVARRDADATWQSAFPVTADWGTHRFPWIAAGASGVVAAAWYGTTDDSPDPDSKWFLFVALSLDADTAEPHWAIIQADPVPVFVGDLQRELLDFFQIEIGPENAIHVSYSKVPAEGGHEQLHYVQSARNLPISYSDYPWGPQAATRSNATLPASGVPGLRLSP